MARFTTQGSEIYLGSARLDPEAVQELKRIFAKESAWAPFDELVAAEDEALIAEQRAGRMALRMGS